MGELDPSTKAIVQIGYSNAGTTPGGGFPAGWHVFDEKLKCTPPACNIYYNFWSPPSGTKSYKVGYDSTNARFDLWYDKSEVDHTVWDPTVEWGFPWPVNLHGETFHCESDVPGTVASPVYFSGITKKESSGTWSTINSLALPTADCPGRYSNNPGADWPRSFSIATLG